MPRSRRGTTKENLKGPAGVNTGGAFSILWLISIGHKYRYLLDKSRGYLYNIVCSYKYLYKVKGGLCYGRTLYLGL